MKNIFKYTSFILAGLLIFTTACIDENYDDSSDVGITDQQLIINVLNTENESGELSIFLELVEEYGLIGNLTSRRTQDQLTVFAPTNEAFETLATQLGYESAEDMLADNESTFQAAILNEFDTETNLLEIVENHVSPANLPIQQIEDGSFRKIATLSGVNIPVNREGGNLTINNDPDLEVLRSNLEGNGTVHIVSRFLMPVKFIAAVSYDFGGDFETCNDRLAAWRVENVVLAGGSGWECTGFGFEGQGIQANGFSGGAQEVDSWIISPVLESNDLVLNTLRFKYASRFDGPNPEIWVVAEEDYDAEAAFDAEAWTQLEFNFPAPANSNNVFSDLGAVIPSDFHSGAYRFAFRYLSGDGATRVTIDNVQVGEE